MDITIVPNENTNTPAGKLADAELHFTEGALEGLKLIGFAIWESRGSGGGRLNVTFPARQYSVNGERRYVRAAARRSPTAARRTACAS